LSRSYSDEQPSDEPPSHNGAGKGDRKIEDRKMEFLLIFLSSIFLSPFPAPLRLGGSSEGLSAAWLRLSHEACNFSPRRGSASQ
jgi:hypothetical protein